MLAAIENAWKSKVVLLMKFSLTGLNKISSEPLSDYRVVHQNGL